MFKYSVNRNAAPLALILLLLVGCGDVSINAGYPKIASAGYWWWPSNTDFTAGRTAAIQEPVDGRIRMHLDAFNGSVAVTGIPGSTSVVINAELLVGSDSQEDAQAGLDLLDIHVTRPVDEIHIQTDQPGFLDGRQYVVNYSIEAPPGLEVFVSQTNGDISVGDVSGTVSITAMNGDVRLSNLPGDVSVDLSSGSIRGTLFPPPGGDISLSAINADIDLNIPVWTSAVLSASSSNGAVTGDNLPLTGPVYTGHSLTGTLGSGSSVIQLQTVNGTIGITGFD